MPYTRTQVKEKYVPKPGKLFDQIKETLRYHHYAIRTEEAYTSWILKFIKFNGTRHPKDMGKTEIEQFLTHLAVKKNVAASTQHQAMHAILFLYREVLHAPVDDKIDPIRTKRPKRLPTVLSQREAGRLINAMEGTHQLMVKLLYGSGLRLMEVIRARVFDLDFDNRLFMVRDGKGNKDRSTLFPVLLHDQLRTHLKRVEILHEEDLKKGYGQVYLPSALSQKYPGAAKSWQWQYVFPSKALSTHA